MTHYKATVIKTVWYVDETTSPSGARPVQRRVHTAQSTDLLNVQRFNKALSSTVQKTCGDYFSRNFLEQVDIYEQDITRHRPYTFYKN